jgi:hypothetical protein
MFHQLAASGDALNVRIMGLIIIGGSATRDWGKDHGYCVCVRGGLCGLHASAWYSVQCNLRMPGLRNLVGCAPLWGVSSI